MSDETTRAPSVRRRTMATRTSSWPAGQPGRPHPGEDAQDRGVIVGAIEHGGILAPAGAKPRRQRGRDLERDTEAGAGSLPRRHSVSGHRPSSGRADRLSPRQRASEQGFHTSLVPVSVPAALERAPRPVDFRGSTEVNQWWARQDSNLQPDRYERIRRTFARRRSPGCETVTKASLWSLISECCASGPRPDMCRDDAEDSRRHGQDDARRSAVSHTRRAAGISAAGMAPPAKRPLSGTFQIAVTPSIRTTQSSATAQRRRSRGTAQPNHGEPESPTPDTMSAGGNPGSSECLGNRLMLPFCVCSNLGSVGSSQ